MFLLLTVKNLNYIRSITTIAAIVFIVIGIMKGEHSIVLEKAINICLQCIGIG